MNAGEPCCCCKARLHAGLAEWHSVCDTCGYESARLEPSINDAEAHAALDETLRDGGLKALRVGNFRELLDRVAPFRPGREMLEVGAAHGWFVALANTRGFHVTGLEPDARVCEQARRSGVPLRLGFFPDALQPGERFDVIAFNDVFEHLPDAVEALRVCRERLNDGGLLVINLPSSRGVFYRLSKLLWRLGAHGFFERLWQKGLPSPHLHYFRADNLNRLGRQEGLEAVTSFHLPSVRVQGLWQRIAYVRAGRNWSAPVVWLCVVAAYPMLALLPADIDVVVFRRAAATRSAG